MELLIKYIIVATTAAVKFMFAPSAGFALNLSFWEVFLSTASGGFIGFLFFFNMSNYFMERALRKRLQKLTQPNVKRPKSFTRINKMIVKIKQSKFGYWALILLAPSFISIPIGSILIAKFYNERQYTSIRMLFSVLLCAFLYTYFSDIIVSLIK